MGANEALTVYGNATMNLTSTALVGDIIALDTLTINAANITLASRAAATLLASTGVLYSSPTSHLLSRLPPSFSVAVLPPGSETGTSGVDDRATFKADLIYVPLSYALNFDTGPIPPPPEPPAPPIVPSFTAEEIEQLFLVANSELFYRLPPMKVDWPYMPHICSRWYLFCNEQAFRFKSWMWNQKVLY
jgi:hypothetical protein